MKKTTILSFCCSLACATLLAGCVAVPKPVQNFTYPLPASIPTAVKPDVEAARSGLATLIAVTNEDLKTYAKTRQISAIWTVINGVVPLLGAGLEAAVKLANPSSTFPYTTAAAGIAATSVAIQQFVGIDNAAGRQLNLFVTGRQKIREIENQLKTLEPAISSTKAEEVNAAVTAIDGVSFTLSTWTADTEVDKP